MPSILQPHPPPAPSSSSSKTNAKVTTYTSESRRSMLPLSPSTTSTLQADSPERLRIALTSGSSSLHAHAHAHVNGHAGRNSSSFQDEHENDVEGKEDELEQVDGRLHHGDDEEEEDEDERNVPSESEEDGDDSEGDMDIEEDSDGDSEMGDRDERIVVHVEARLRPDSTGLLRSLEPSLMSFVQTIERPITLGARLLGWDEIAVLNSNVERVWVGEGPQGVSSVRPADAKIQLHIYRANESDDLEEFSADFDDDDEEKVTAASMRVLPSLELDGIWDTLVYADDLKTRLLNYIYSTIHFSELQIDSDIVAWNRVVLLHGPPGTGKTSLCRALAQKISVRLDKSYSQGKLIEINSHSLFSKWFSESGKLVQRLFETVTKEVDDESQFVVVMIDEVESLTAARAGAMRGNEPSDSLRVVNALLTQLDKLRMRKNVLVMTTSNLAEAIDEAFISRVDMQEYVPLPPPQAVYHILSGCLDEMMSKELMKRVILLKWDAANYSAGSKERESERKERVGAALAVLAKRCYSLEISGRTLRRLPVLAYARFLLPRSGKHRPHRIERWLEAMNSYIDVEQENKRQEAARARLVANGVAIGSQDAGNGAGHGHGRGHARVASIDRSEVGTMVGTAIAGEKGPHHGH
ncbi:hypothetical protein I317_04567 [Kwoniella heveanensis CBS 569]|nr:hypothetical protein I317_04567 [Kwoniella heveanensis CBS 569]